MTGPLKRVSSLACALALALSLSACATTVSTDSFKGEAKNVAQTIKNLQSHVTTGEQKKICEDDLAAAVVKSLGPAPGGCQQVIKNQLAEIASVELTINSVDVAGDSATARVTSKYSGKNRVSTISLVKEDGKWKIAKLS